MTLESPIDFIDDLDITLPLENDAADPRSEGDDHIRNIKKVVKASFPNVDGACTPTPAQFNLLTAADTGAGDTLFLKDSTGRAKTAFGLKAVDLGATTTPALNLATNNLYISTSPSSALTATVSGQQPGRWALWAYRETTGNPNLGISWTGPATIYKIPSDEAVNAAGSSHALFWILGINSTTVLVVALSTRSLNP